jgi:hypothetical protein
MKNRLLIIDDEPHTCEVVSGFWQLLKNNSGLGETGGAGGGERSPAQSAGCSKRPDFSPAQPWGAERRLVPSKAAASEVG